MTSRAEPDVWAPPEPTQETPPGTGGAELVFAMPPQDFRKETRAWIRSTRWWAHPLLALVALAVSPVVFLVGMFAVGVGVSFPAVSLFWACFGVIPLVMAMRPYGLARSMASKLDRSGESHLRVVNGEVVLTNHRELRAPLTRLTRIRERPGYVWLCFGKGLAIFVPRRPRLGDVDAFLKAVRDSRDAPRPAPVFDEVAARAAFAPPSRVIHIARTYAVALRSPLFLLLVVFAALSLVGAVASMPWQVSQTLVVPLALLGASLVFLLATPAIRIGLGSRHRLGEPGTVTVWSAHPDVVRIDGPNGSLDVPWNEVVGVKRIGGFGVLELTSGKLILGLSDAVSGDPLALFQAIDSHAGASARG